MTLKLIRPAKGYSAGTICKVVLRLKLGGSAHLKVRFANGETAVIPSDCFRELHPLEQLATD